VFQLLSWKEDQVSDPGLPESEEGKRIRVFPEDQDQAQVGVLGPKTCQHPFNRWVARHGFQIDDGAAGRSFPNHTVQSAPRMAQGNGVFRLQKPRQPDLQLPGSSQNRQKSHKTFGKDIP